MVYCSFRNFMDVKGQSAETAVQICFIQVINPAFIQSLLLIRQMAYQNKPGIPRFVIRAQDSDF